MSYQVTASTSPDTKQNAGRGGEVSVEASPLEKFDVADQLSRVVIGKRDKEGGVPREYAPSSPAQDSCGHGARRDSATLTGKCLLSETPAGMISALDHFTERILRFCDTRPLSKEQERLENEAAELEGALTEASGYPIPGESRF